MEKEKKWHPIKGSQLKSSVRQDEEEERTGWRRGSMQGWSAFELGASHELGKSGDKQIWKL